MARRGSFGGSLRPYGSLGTGFASYSIGKTAGDLAALRRYAVEVAWSNGQASNADYLKALQDEVAATDPNTEQRISAQNKLDDATFRIGRALAKQTGDPEALITFDQTALAGMRADSLRYQDLKETLNAELANRRSTQYGHLVDQYQAGDLTTQTLLSWVTSTLGGLAADAPDRQQWVSAKSDLEGRVQGETDSRVFQDYQRERMSGPAFLAYLTSRRDSYLPGSPLYDEWTRKLEDATVQVQESALAKQDKAFFDAYNRGGLGDPGDHEYVAYIRTRLAGMKPDDPARADWENRLHTATYSIAEDHLRLDVAEGTRPASDLVAFYQHYQTTLNPDSPEWRTVQGKVDEAQRADFAESESMIRFKVANNLLPPTALVTFFEKHLATLPEGTSEWRAAYADLQNARDAANANVESSLRWNAAHPEAQVPVGAAPAGSLPSPVGGIVPPAGAKFGGIRGGHYSAAELDYVANRMAQLTGLDPSVTRVWALKEEGGGNNPYGVSGVGSAGNSGIRANFKTIDEGINAAASWVNTHGNMSGIKASVGQSVAEQIAAIDRSPWGPAGQNGGYKGSLVGLAKGNLRAPATTYGVIPGPAMPGGTEPPGAKPPGQTDPTGNLRELERFYEDQLAAQTKGTPAWQSTYEKLQGVKEALGKQAVGATTPGKVISPRATLETLVQQVTIGPASAPFAIANYELNHDSLYNAWQRGDSVWLFYDPASPNATTWAKNPDGSYAKGPDGKNVIVRGSGYYAVTDEAVARLQAVKRDYYLGLSEVARANGQNTDAAKFQNQAIEANDTLRAIDNKVYRASLRSFLDGNGVQPGMNAQIDHAWTVGDLAGVVNGTTATLALIREISADPNLDDASRGSLATRADGLASGPLFPDATQGRLGAIDTANSIGHVDPATGRTVWDQIALAPGNHLAFKMDGGRKTFEVVNADNLAPGTWEQSHVVVHVQFGDRVVSGEAKIDQASLIDPLVAATVDGDPKVFHLGGQAMSATFFDGSGRAQTAYSIDNGATWIRSNSGVLPQLALTADLTEAHVDPEKGTVTYFTSSPQDEIGGRAGGERLSGPLLTTDYAGNIITVDRTLVEWHGQSEAMAGLANNPFSDARVQQLYNSGASADVIRAAILEDQATGPRQVNVGGPGQAMTLAFTGPDGTVNMLPAAMRLRPDWTPTGGFSSANDLLGKSTAQIAALAPVRHAFESGYIPAAALPAAPTSTAMPSVEARFALAAQLPTGTPARIEGVGSDIAPAVPLRPLPPAQTVTLPPPRPLPATPAIVTPNLEPPRVTPPPAKPKATVTPKAAPKPIPAPIIPRSGPAVPL